MALLVCRAISLATGLLSKRDSRIQFVHVDTCEVHRALDSQSKAWVEFANHRRFLMHDLILGRVRRDHRLWGYLTGCGAREDELRLLEGNPARFDILGLDYYIHSEMEWQWDDDSGCSRIVHPCERADGFANVARAYGSRYGVPVMLCETNIRGSVTDRLTWLKFMSEQVEQLAAAGVDVRGFCWFPSIDSTDWCHVCTRSTGSVDPQGIWLLDEGRWARRASKLSTAYSQLCRGRVSTNDLPAYPFNEPLSEAVRGFGHLMSHWAYPGADNDSEMAA